MKRFISRAGLIAVMLFSFSLQSVRGDDKALKAEALELSAGMQVAEWEAVYVPLRDLAKAAEKEKRLKDAADFYVRAAYQHRVPAFRAAALRNAAFHSSRIGDCFRARQLWNESLQLLALIRENPDKFPGHESTNKKTRRDTRWGLYGSACRLDLK